MLQNVLYATRSNTLHGLLHSMLHTCSIAHTNQLNRKHLPNTLPTWLPNKLPTKTPYPHGSLPNTLHGSLHGSFVYSEAKLGWVDAIMRRFKKRTIHKVDEA